MELLHRYSGLGQRMIGEQFGGLDEGLVSRDRRGIRKRLMLNRRSESGFRISLSQDLTLGQPFPQVTSRAAISCLVTEMSHSAIYLSLAPHSRTKTQNVAQLSSTEGPI